MNGEFYLIGGRGTRPLDIYDPATNAWRVGASPPIELHHFQAIVYDNEIWVVGHSPETIQTERQSNKYTSTTQQTMRGELVRPLIDHGAEAERSFVRVRSTSSAV